MSKINIIFNIASNYLIPLYRAASEKVHNLKIRLKRPLTTMHYLFGFSGKHVTQDSSYESPYA